MTEPDGNGPACRGPEPEDIRGWDEVPAVYPSGVNVYTPPPHSLYPGPLLSFSGEDGSAVFVCYLDPSMASAFHQRLGEAMETIRRRFC